MSAQVTFLIVNIYICIKVFTYLLIHLFYYFLFLVFGYLPLGLSCFVVIHFTFSLAKVCGRRVVSVVWAI